MDFMNTIGTESNEQETQVVTRNVIANAKLSGYVQRNRNPKYRYQISALHIDGIPNWRRKYSAHEPAETK